MWKKQKKRRNLQFMLPLSLLLLLSGCQTNRVPSESVSVEASAAASSQASVDETDRAVAQEASAETQEIIDHAGRTVLVPETIKTVYSTSPIGTMLMYTFDDRMVAGVNVAISEAERAYLTEYYTSLPHLGGWYGKGNQGNIEEIIKAAPDLVLSSGTDQGSIDQAEQLQQQLGIPVILVKSDLADLPETYQFLGELLKKPERGEELAAYIETTLAETKRIAEQIPEAEKIRVYYAEEQDGLHTDPSGSSHSQLIDLCGGINVADCEITQGYGRTAVSIEQVMKWDPQLIICSVDNGYADSSSYQTIMNDPAWSMIRAVKDQLVFETPMQPQNWFDRPPSVNTIIGLKWTQALLYPDYIDYDIRAEAKAFYELFYHVELSDQDIEIIMPNALRK